jgi:gamma-glutamylputrescine oxidase
MQALSIDKLSYWEQKTYFSNTDFIVIGAGIVGYSTALYLREKHPNASILILERGYLPSGASSKNAGFACFGSPTELYDDLQHIPENQVWDTLEMRWNGLKRLFSIIPPEKFDYQQNGSWDLIHTDTPQEELLSADFIRYLNQKGKEITGFDNIYSEDKIVSNQFGFNHISTSYFNRLEGQIDTSLLNQAFYQKTILENIKCLFGVNVNHFQEDANNVMLDTNIGEIKGAHLFICTNGLATEFFPDRVKPARAQVLITEPIPNLELKGTFHYQKGYYYFRNIDNRILLGGGRNLDFDGETTTNFGLTENIQSSLENLLYNTITPKFKPAIAHRWSGIMGVGEEKKPIVEKIGKRIAVGVRMGGMGVAIGSQVGKQLSELF